MFELIKLYFHYDTSALSSETDAEDSGQK